MDIISEFDQITPAKIVEQVKKKESGFYYNRKPKELLKTPYSYGQTLILKGYKENFDGLIDFWLSCQAWYSDGEDTMYEKLIFDDIGGYSEWYNEEYRVGICRLAVEEEKNEYKKILTVKAKELKPIDFLIMNPSWNHKKVLFTDMNHYYLYFFWTGE